MLDFGLTTILWFCGLVIFFTVWVLASRSEAKQWNKGKCVVCQGDWECFDTDSQGGRGYKCGCERRSWISFNVDRKRVA